MIVADEHAGELVSGFHQTHQARITAEQVIQPCAGDKLAFHAGQCRCLRVIERQFVPEQGGFSSFAPVDLCSQQIVKRGAFFRAHQHGWNVCLGIDLLSVVDTPVQVDGEAGDGCDRRFEVHKLIGNALICLERDATSERQVAVKPGI